VTDSVTFARPYAEAAHKIASETNNIKAWLENLTVLSTTIKDGKVKAILASPTVNEKQKIDFLKEMMSKKSNDFTRFLEILLENKKIYYIDSIAELFHEMVLADDQILTATVETAYPLSSEQKDKLSKKLQKQHSKKIMIEESVNKSLIAGIKIHVNNQVIDHSIKFRVNAMREQIKER
tara:strand:- start:620 stop:1156 length:537 start_codon:yes stop_codon:yes gene_type:complete